MTPMDTTPSSAGSVDARIQGDVSGQVAVGHNILQNNVSHGGVVYVAAPGQTPTVRRRSSPIRLAGRAEPPLLGREAELGEVASALELSGVVQVCGSAGAGKTSLLKSVIHDPLPATAADGVVYHNALAEPVEDTLQFLFEAFYTSDVPVKLPDGEIRHALQPIRALLALDDVTESGPDRMRQVLDAAPNATFLLASPRPVLRGADPSLALRGLAEEPALGVLERGLGRALTARERPPARSIVRALEGQPLRLVQVAGVVNALNWSLAALARDMRSGNAVEVLAQNTFSSLSDDQRDVLALLAAMDRAPLYVNNVAELTGIADLGPVVESLLLLALVQAHSPRFSLTAELSDDRYQDLDPDRWRDRVLESLPHWVERQGDPQAVVKEAAAILQVLEDGLARGAWTKVLRLARTVETPLILGARWGAWESVLGHELQAARRLGERSAEGWSLHQLGTRALCLGDTVTARSQLSEALRIRESLGDVDGAAVTRHNLEFLSGPPPRPGPPKEPPPKPSGGGWGPPTVPIEPRPEPSDRRRTPILVGAAAMVVLILGLAAASLRVTSDTAQPVTSVDLLAGELSAEALDFGNQEVGTTSYVLGAQLANGGNEPVAVDAVTLSGASPNDFVISDDPCSGVSVAPGDACMVGVRFRPTTIGLRDATVVITGAGRTLTVHLRGNGTDPPPAVGDTMVEGPGEPPALRLATEPSNLSFPNQPILTESPPKTVTVRNHGAAPVTLDQGSVIGPHGGDFVFDDGCAGRTLLPGVRCSQNFTFRPTETGVRSATLQIKPSDGGAPLLMVLGGTGTPTADLAVTMEPDDEGRRLVTVTNNGPSSVGGATLTVRGDAVAYGEFEVQGMDCRPPLEDDVELLGQRLCTVSSLSPTDTATLTLLICGDVAVEVKADEFDPNEANNTEAFDASCDLLGVVPGQS